MGFSPVQRTIARRTAGPEEMTIDVQFGGTPLALSVVEVAGNPDALGPRQPEQALKFDATVPNPVSEILALKDTLHLSAVQIVGLIDLADTLQANNTRIYRNIRMLLAKLAGGGRRDSDGGQHRDNARGGIGKYGARGDRSGKAPASTPESGSCWSSMPTARGSLKGTVKPWFVISVSIFIGIAVRVPGLPAIGGVE